ncbi:hypothetical protein, partial [uncultured Muribaculum sp.]|uniref:hypothetical protein n=1 Tax=uncultured Muribaculum sp. TaxID=1918613 RepID=UPI00273039F4
LKGYGNITDCKYTQKELITEIFYFFYLNYLDKWIELCMNKWMGWSLFCYISEDKVLDYTGHRFASCGTCCLEARL